MPSNLILPEGIVETFYFAYGVAYDPDKKVFYTYRSQQGDEVVLRSSYSRIKPYLKNSHWIRQGRRKHFYYTCHLPSAQCPITNLPF